MKLKDKYEDNGALFYTIELDNDVFVDVKHVGNLYYVMDCEDGYMTYDSNRNSFDYHFNENEVIDFVKKYSAQTSKCN